MCFPMPRYQVSIYRTIGPLVLYVHVYTRSRNGIRCVYIIYSYFYSKLYIVYTVELVLFGSYSTL